MSMEKKEDHGLSMVVLAGGRSSRMGTDKSDLLYKEQTFLETQIQKGQKLGIDDILISGYRGRACSGRVVPDRFVGKGPLGGLEACLRQAIHPRCLVLSVDTPLVSVAALQGLIREDQKRKDHDACATILAHGEEQEPLIGIYQTDQADMMAEALENGRGSVFAFLKKVGYRVYQSTGADPQFRNINEQADYQDLLKINNDSAPASRS